MRSARVVLASLLGAAMVLAGPAAPGSASVIDLTALAARAPLTITGGAAGSVGVSGIGLSTGAATATTTGLGMNVAATGVGGGVAATGAAAPLAGPALAAAGAFVVGYGIGTFACGHIDFCADDELTPSNPAYLPNADTALDPGTCPVADLVVGASRTCAFTLQPAGSPAVQPVGTVQIQRYAVDSSCGISTFPNGVTDTAIPSATGCWHATVTDSNGTSTPAGGLVIGNVDLSQRNEIGNTNSTGNPFSVWFRTGPQPGYSPWVTFAVRDICCSTLTPPNPVLWGRVDVASGPVDPERTFVTHGQCVKGAVLQQRTATSRVFVESEGHIPKYPDVSCPAGFGLIGVQVHKVTPSLPGDEVVWEWTPDPDTDPWAAVPKLYPECAGGTCVLRLWKLLSGSRLDCYDTPGACRGWFADPSKATNYECTYGSHVVALTDCYPLRPTFDVLVELDGGPKTETSPDTGLGTDPNPHANPDGSVDPSPEPSTDPGAGRACPPDAGFLSFLNPFWLFDTLKCAFVPTQTGLRAGWESAGVDWCETAPGALICASDALVAPFGELGNGSDADCLGAAVTIPNTLTDNPADDGEVHPFQACGQLAQVSDWWLLFASAAIYLGTALTAARILGGTIGAREAVPA